MGVPSPGNAAGGFSLTAGGGSGMGGWITAAFPGAPTTLPGGLALGP